MFSPLTHCLVCLFGFSTAHFEDTYSLLPLSLMNVITNAEICIQHCDYLPRCHLSFSSEPLLQEGWNAFPPLAPLHKILDSQLCDIYGIISTYTNHCSGVKEESLIFLCKQGGPPGWTEYEALGEIYRCLWMLSRILTCRDIFLAFSVHISPNYVE